MQALVRFSHIAAGALFTTADVHADTAEALGRTVSAYKLDSLRYDLFKLRTKRLVEKVPVLFLIPDSRGFCRWLLGA